LSLGILITGGAGFIGSHLAKELIRCGHQVRVLDVLAPQIHGPGCVRPPYLHRDVELIVGDIRDPIAVNRALKGIDAVYHLVANVGVGQSMYQIADYTSVNTFGTAVLLQKLAEHPVSRLIVASSMSIYGEGLYKTSRNKLCMNAERSLAQLQAGQWEPLDDDRKPMSPVATPESKTSSLQSLYALSKFDQERLCLLIGRAYSIPATALRLFNTYGPDQALSNPYTGVLSNFASRIMNGGAPLIFEDGRQKRDFVSVHDVARAFRLVLDHPESAGHAINIGSGRPLTVLEAAQKTIAAMGRRDVRPIVTGKYRAGDIRHCFGDISLARKLLGYEPRISLDEGVAELAAWLHTQVAVDRGLEARAELAARGLLV
jgi:dTDP-L-rhamnose 4-epimerase